MKLEYLCSGLNVTDDKQAIKIFRCIRWATGVYCPDCKSFDTLMAGGGSDGKVNRYICKNCNLNFNDFTGTIFHNSKISLGEIIYILSNLSTKSIKQISEELSCSRQTVHRVSKMFYEEVDSLSKRKQNI